MSLLSSDTPSGAVVKSSSVRFIFMDNLLLSSGNREGIRVCVSNFDLVAACYFYFLPGQYVLFTEEIKQIEQKMVDTAF